MKAQLPTNVDIARARLPQTYEQAKVALASCERIDECHEWANKAEALASYAKMADDDSLRVLADRIQARAVRRMGDLLKQWPVKPNPRGQRAHLIIEKEDRSRREVAFDSGLTQQQYERAMAVVKVEEPTFEALVESDTPPTINTLVGMGRTPKSVPEGFKQATHVIGTIKRFAEFCAENAPDLVANGVMSQEVPQIMGQTAAIDLWLKVFRSSLTKEYVNG